MYQDKVPQSDIDAIEESKRVSPYLSIFETKKLLPLSFEPTELLTDICQIARDILKGRSDEDIIIISKAIKSMSEQGAAFALALLRNDETRKQVYISQGRELYFLLDYYDISSLEIKKLTWSEVFAVLALMQCAEVTLSASQKYNDNELSQALKKNAEMFPIIMQGEIADSIARAECLFDTKHQAKTLGSRGGGTKAKRMEPLKVEVITRYMKKYTTYSNRRAGMLIESELDSEKNELLNLSGSEELNIQFSKWIGSYKTGKWKMPLNI